MEENTMSVKGGVGRVDEWRSRIESWRGSGDSGAGWCRANGVSYQSFIYWKRKFSMDMASGGGATGFVELDSPEPGSGVELDVAGVRIHVRGDFDGAAFVKAVALLRGA